MTSMLEGAVIFSAKIRVWDVHNVVYCKNFSKNCCHMRHNLPQFSKHALSLSLLVPLPEMSYDFDSYEEPIELPIELPKELPKESPLLSDRYIPTNPLQYTHPFQLISSVSPIINTAVQKISPVKSPSPEVEYIGTKFPSPDVEYIGTKFPSPDVEYIGTKRPARSNFFTDSGTLGGYTRKKTKRKKMNKTKNKKIINDILVTDLAY
jgi:hypothetical protein